MQIKKICYCGSLRVALDAFKKAEYESVMRGDIALLPCCMFVDIEREYGAESDYKQKADDLHKRKIDVCDEVMVLNVNGYIGESTRSEIAYAESIGRPVRYLEPLAHRAQSSDKVQDDINPNSTVHKLAVLLKEALDRLKRYDPDDLHDVDFITRAENEAAAIALATGKDAASEVLPERWAIKRTPENAGIVNAWLDKTYPETAPFKKTSLIIHHPSTEEGGGYLRLVLQPGYTAITTDQFKKLVLKQ